VRVRVREVVGVGRGRRRVRRADRGIAGLAISETIQFSQIWSRALKQNSIYTQYDTIRD
jgi:hypothetical protein